MPVKKGGQQEQRANKQTPLAQENEDFVPSKYVREERPPWGDVKKEVRVMDKVAIGELLKVFRDASEDIAAQKSSCETIFEIARAKENRAALSELAALELLVICLQSNYQKERELSRVCCLAIWSILYQNQQSKELFLSKLYHQSINKAINTHFQYAPLQFGAGGVLLTLVRDNLEFATKLVDNNVLDLVAPIMRAHSKDSSVQELYCELICTLSGYDNEMIAMKVAKCGITVPILDAMAGFPNSVNIQDIGCEVVARLGMHDRTTMATLLSINDVCVQHIMQIIRRHAMNERVVVSALRALVRLAGESDYGVALVIVYGGLAVVLSAMDKFKSSLAVQNLGCRLVLHLLHYKSDEIVKELLVQSDVRARIGTALGLFPSSIDLAEVAVLAMVCLILYCPETRSSMISQQYLDPVFKAMLLHTKKSSDVFSQGCLLLIALSTKKATSAERTKIMKLGAVATLFEVHKIAKLEDAKVRLYWGAAIWSLVDNLTESPLEQHQDELLAVYNNSSIMGFIWETMLNNHDKKDVQFRGCLAMEQIFKHLSIEQRRHSALNGSIDFLKGALLKFQDYKELQLVGSRALMDLADYLTEQEVLSEIAVELVLARFHVSQEEEAVVEACCLAIDGFIRSKFNLQPLEHLIVQLMLNAMGRFPVNKRVQCTGCFYFDMLAERKRFPGFEDEINTVVVQGAPLVVAAVKTFPSNLVIQKNAWDFFNHILMDLEVSKMLSNKCDVANAAVVVLHYLQIPSDVLIVVLSVLVSICKPVDAEKIRSHLALKSELFELLRTLVGQSEKTLPLVEEYCKLCDTFLSVEENDEVAMAMINKGVLGTFFSITKSHFKNKTVVSTSLKLFCTFSKLKGGKDEMVSKFGVSTVNETVLRLMNSFPQDEILQEFGNGTLKNISDGAKLTSGESIGSVIDRLRQSTDASLHCNAISSLNAMLIEGESTALKQDMLDILGNSLLSQSGHINCVDMILQMLLRLLDTRIDSDTTIECIPIDLVKAVISVTKMHEREVALQTHGLLLLRALLQIGHEEHAVLLSEVALEAMRNHLIREEVQYAGCTVICIAALKRNFELKEFLLGNGAITTILASMKYHQESCRVQSNGCCCITYLMKDQAKLPDGTNFSDLFYSIADARKNSPDNCEVLEYSCLALQKLTEIDVTRAQEMKVSNQILEIIDAIRQSGSAGNFLADSAYPTLLAALKEPPSSEEDISSIAERVLGPVLRKGVSSKEVAKSAISTVREVTKWSDRAKLALIEKDIHKQIAVLMDEYSANPAVLLEACGVLANLASHPMRKGKMTRDGSGKVALKAARQHESDARVQMSAFGVLWNLGADKESAQVLFELGAVDTVLKGMKIHFEQVEVQHRACGVLWNLAREGEITRVALIGAGAGDRIFEAVVKYLSNSKLLVQALGALTNLAGKRGLFTGLRKEEFEDRLKSISNAMKSHFKNVTIQQFGCRLLLKSTQCEYASKLLFEMALELHKSSEKIQQSAGQFLKQLNQI